MYPNFSPRRVKSRGPDTAEILVIGDCPDEDAEQVGRAFVGSVGQELDRELSEARFITSACRFTNVVPHKPLRTESDSYFAPRDLDVAFERSERGALLHNASNYMGRWCHKVILDGIALLREEIRQTNPKVLIAVGGHALWALTGKEGISDWRGSTLVYQNDGLTIPVMPIQHPKSILKNWELRHLAIKDLKRANKIWQFGPEPCPPWDFILRPNFTSAMEALNVVEAHPEVAVDIETKRGHIVCVALAWSKTQAICIPFVDRHGAPYWREEEELALVSRLRHILTSHFIQGQNFHYDAQYFARRMLVIPKCGYDTMLAQHVLFPGTDKSLAHLSSLYCPYHIFWKDDGKEWDPRIHAEEQLWRYNCVDAVKTFEVREAQQHLINKYGLQKQMQFMMDVWPHILMTMLRGVKIDQNLQTQLCKELGDAINERQLWLNKVVGREFNCKSTLQMQMLFADELGVKLKKGKKTKGVSLDKKALHKIGDDHILLWPIVRVIEEIRSLGVFKSTFAEASLDEDGRMRCSYNQGGTETFRESSSENAFGSGTNLQNIPSGNRSTTMKMPNMRKPFVPDEGMEIAEIDLAGADAQVLAWDYDVPALKAAFKNGLKIHVVNNKAMYGKLAGEDGKAEPYYTRIKQGVHLTNYCGKASTMADTLNIKRAEAEAFQEKWFALNPAIPKGHARTERELMTTRMVINQFGFRRVYFDRIENLLAAAVAWKPQSTIAIVANEIWKRLGTEPGLPVEVLLQVHDSLVFQYPIAQRDDILSRVRRITRVVIPYADPLIIPLGLKTSTKSWGDCTECKWPE